MGSPQSSLPQGRNRCRQAWGSQSAERGSVRSKSKEDPDHSVSLVADAEFPGVSEEGSSFMAGLGAARSGEVS